ncbi:MAG: glycosyltransferase family 39 protein [bacterium]|nr:glycosyltransferase family 39 protein [bacterium]
MSLAREIVSRLSNRWRYRPDDTRARRADLLLLLLLGLLTFSAGIGLKDPWAPDEPRFALIARDMVESGDWFFPRRAAELYADKPPVFMWAQALVYAVTGSVRIAHLLPSLIAGLLTLALVYDLGRRLWHRRAGLGAGLVLLLAVQFPLQARAGQIDAMATMWTTLGLYGLCRHVLVGPHWRGWWLGCFAMGLGVITKGVGFLPLLALIPWGVGHWRGWPGLPALRPGGWRWWLGPLLLLAAIGLWLVPMLALVAGSGDPALEAYRDEILWGQTAQRYASIGGHQQPLWYYPLQAMPLLWLPVTLALPWLIPAWWRRLRRRDPRLLLLLGWIALVALFFTFSSGKRGVYILPALPAFALAVGPLAAGIERKAGPRRIAFGFLILLTAIFAVAAGAGWLGLDAAAEIAEETGSAPWLLLTTLALAGLCWAAWQRPRAGVAALAGFLFSVWLLYGWWGTPLLNPARSPADLMDRAAAHTGPFAELAMVGWKEQLVLHADRPATHWGFIPDHLFSLPETERQMHAASAWLAEGTESRWLLLSDRWLEPCFDPERAFDLGEKHRRRWLLVDLSALSGACGPDTQGFPAEEGPVYRTAEPP